MKVSEIIEILKKKRWDAISKIHKIKIKRNYIEIRLDK